MMMSTSAEHILSFLYESQKPLTKKERPLSQKPLIVKELKV